MNSLMVFLGFLLPIPKILCAASTPRKYPCSGSFLVIGKAYKMCYGCDVFMKTYLRPLGSGQPNVRRGTNKRISYS